LRWYQVAFGEAEVENREISRRERRVQKTNSLLVIIGVVEESSKFGEWFDSRKSGRRESLGKKREHVRKKKGRHAQRILRKLGGGAQACIPCFTSKTHGCA